MLCLIWDAFKAQTTEKFKLEPEHLRIKDVKVPKSMTHLFQPLDLQTDLDITLPLALRKHYWLIPNKMLLQQKLI